MPYLLYYSYADHYGIGALEQIYWKWRCTAPGCSFTKYYGLFLSATWHSSLSLFFADIGTDWTKAKQHPYWQLRRQLYRRCLTSEQSCSHLPPRFSEASIYWSIHRHWSLCIALESQDKRILYIFLLWIMISLYARIFTYIKCTTK